MDRKFEEKLTKQGRCFELIQTHIVPDGLEKEGGKKNLEKVRDWVLYCVRWLFPRLPTAGNVKRSSWLRAVLTPQQSRQRRGPPPPPKGFNMAKLNSGSSGCRAVVLAGKYLSSPSPLALTRSSSQRQRRMFGPRRCMMSSDVSGGKAGKPAQQQQQQDSLGCLSAADRHAPANRNLIYRDVRAFLNEVGGDPREARYWLTQFQSATATQSPAFAVLEVRRQIQKFELKNK